MNTRYLIPICIPMMVFSIWLTNYADVMIKHPEMNNTRDIWIGDGQDHTFFILRFDKDCWKNIGTTQDPFIIELGNDHWTFFDDNITSIPECVNNGVEG